MTRRGTGSTTVSSSVGSSRNTSGIRMEAYYFLSHRITAVNTITLVLRDTAVHAASHTLSNEHRLPPFSNSCAKDHYTSLNFLSSFLQCCAVFCISTESCWGPSKSDFVAPLPARSVIYPCKAVSSPPAPCNQNCGPHSWGWLSKMRTVLSAHLKQKTQSNKDTNRAWFLGQ